MPDNPGTLTQLEALTHSELRQVVNRPEREQSRVASAGRQRSFERQLKSEVSIAAFKAHQAPVPRLDRARPPSALRRQQLQRRADHTARHGNTEWLKTETGPDGT